MAKETNKTTTEAATAAPEYMGDFGGAPEDHADVPLGEAAEAERADKAEEPQPAAEALSASTEKG